MGSGSRSPAHWPIEGARVALVARGAKALDEAAHALSALASATGSPVAASGAERDPHVIAVSADTGSDDSVAAMVARVVDEFGGVDILVNAAATPNTGGFGEDALEAEFNVKVRGYLRCARAVAPLMAAGGWGRIVNVSGLAARQTGSVVGIGAQRRRRGADEEPRRRARPVRGST